MMNYQQTPQITVVAQNRSSIHLSSSSNPHQQS